jgi:mRNA degradation ribonuclease J1/J2
MDSETGDLAFLPLGGTGEIGMNLNLYRCDGKWLAVDCGIGFGGAAHPEVDVMMPDPGYIADRRDRLLGLVITHAHEDHIGAVAWLWPQLRCPVYATPFAATVLRRKLAEVQLLNQVKLHVVPPGGAIDLAPFNLQFLRVTHSIPEAQALVIDTPHGLLLHTGDWKLDPDRTADRRDCIRCTGRARRAGDDRRFHQRDGRRPLRQRSRGAAEPDGTAARAARTHRGDLLRVQRGACRVSGARGPRRGPQRGAGRPLAAQPRRRGARVRLPA